jgi:hypothetical protein
MIHKDERVYLSFSNAMKIQSYIAFEHQQLV